MRFGGAAAGLRWRRLRRRFLGGLTLRFPPTIPLLRAPAPLAVREFRVSDRPTRDLLICLPGIADVFDDYHAYGFVDAVVASAAPADVIVVDAHFGYYARRTILERLREDVVLPARGAGYERLWLVGISLGGFGALLYAASHPEDLHGLILLAPYLGDDRLIDDIAAAGGIAGWTPGDAADDDFARKIWVWSKEVALGRQRTVIVLGFGDADRFARANRLLAEGLPSDAVHVVPGGHDWRTWKNVWDRIFLDPKRLGLGP